VSFRRRQVCAAHAAPSPFRRGNGRLQFHPSTHLGGDGLGYRRINDDQLAFYVLDVTGHGLGSALLAVTALELLRNPVAQVDFASPAAVIDRLNRTFQMKDHAGKFFSAWYGVYSRSARTVTYANAGHPARALLTRQNGAFRLSRTEPGASVLGILPEIHAPGNHHRLFSHVRTLPLHGWPLRTARSQRRSGFLRRIPGLPRKAGHEGKPAWDAMLQWLDRARSRKMIDDDVSLLRFATKG